jgi:RsiW-degrading membrane proteinase PrsW (M82 family)
MLLLVLAIAPGLAIALYIYHKDKYDKEPKKYLIVSFLLGMFSTLPAIVLQTTASAIFGEMRAADPIPFYAFYAFVIVACSEEGCKFLMVRLYAYPKAAFNEPFDGIVYAVMVAMGFATLENINYVEQYGLGTALLRMVLSVPAHASFGVLMGHYMGLAKFNKGKEGSLMIKGLLIAIFFHGSFDFFLFLQSNTRVTPYVSNGLLGLGAIVSYYIAVRLSMRSIRWHQEMMMGTDYDQKNKLL